MYIDVHSRVRYEDKGTPHLNSGVVQVTNFQTKPKILDRQNGQNCRFGHPLGQKCISKGVQLAFCVLLWAQATPRPRRVRYKEGMRGFGGRAPPPPGPEEGRTTTPHLPRGSDPGGSQDPPEQVKVFLQALRTKNLAPCPPRHQLTMK